MTLYDKDYIEKINEKERLGRDNGKKVTSKYPERYEKFYTNSNQEVDRLYTESDIQDLDYLEDLGFPGQYPYTRGVQPTIQR